MSGEAEPTDEEVAAGEAVTAKDKEDEEDDDEENDLVKSLAKLTTKTKKKAEEAAEEKEEGEPAKGVPQFWLTALRNHAELQSLISERDEEALAYLTDIKYVLLANNFALADRTLDRLSYLPEPDLGFMLSFVFEENPFFENKELDKAYFYQVRFVPSQGRVRLTQTPNLASLERTWLHGRISLPTGYRHKNQMEGGEGPHQERRNQETTEQE